LRFSGYAELHLEAPTLGEHNAQVLADYLGYPAARVDQLETMGVLKQGPR